ncbi:hypothetical protein F6V25_14355 [Oryzomonas japonica]|uniref:Nucleotidyltransferase family protein n=1 Tax=Oryzomonas japonica TaxID=2603858 RepID=A0A7J4ZMR2_9BACT|nr:hypothetical protein [Oryzomonas japonica]KAB0663993.1 hypothetical protein F6V25_14355 [Oryzomonas japonica]
MSIPLGDMSLAELAAYVSDHLTGQGIDVVLSGGGCVSVYSDNRYRSDDLDFIERYREDRKKLAAALDMIGFKPKRRYFVHPDTPFFLEFPTGPLSIGSEPVREIAEMAFSTGTLRMLTPTDCIKDRLAHYFHWGDKQGLEQALMVAGSCLIDLDELARWSRVEGMSDEFESIKGRLLSASANR